MGADIHAFHRRLKLLDYFDGSHNHNPLPFRKKSNWEPPLNNISTPVIDFTECNNKLAYRIKHHIAEQDNLTEPHRAALRQSNLDIIIKPADKGSAIVLMDKQQYPLEAYCQLHDNKHYMSLPHPIQAETQTQVTSVFQSLKQKF